MDYSPLYYIHKGKPWEGKPRERGIEIGIEKEGKGHVL